jgi:hypothetical protein
VASSKFAIVGYLVGGIVGRMAIIVATLWWMCRRWGSTTTRVHSAAWFFLSIGLVASLPIAVSPKVMGHYFVPSVPMFALAAAAFAQPAIGMLDGLASGRWGQRMPLILASGLLSATILVPVLHGTLEPRDREAVATLDAVSSAIPRGATVGACRTSQYDWGLQTYLERFFRVALDARDAPVNGWFLHSADAACAPPVECQPVAQGYTVTLYQCGASSWH